MQIFKRKTYVKNFVLFHDFFYHLSICKYLNFSDLLGCGGGAGCGQEKNLAFFDW